MSIFPSKFQKWLSQGLSTQQIDNRKLCRRVLDRLILGFADQQLITGFALLVSGYATVYNGPAGSGGFPNNGAHWNLLVYMSCLSSSTHLACVLTLRKYFGIHRITAIIRVVLIVLFSLLLIPSILVSFDPSLGHVPHNTSLEAVARNAYVQNFTDYRDTDVVLFPSIYDPNNFTCCA